MLGAVQWFALIGLITIGFIFVIELLKWRAPGNVIGARQKAIRVSLLVLIEALFVMILLGPVLTAGKGTIGELIYWTVCLSIGLAVFILALFDLRAVSAEFSSRSRRSMQDMARDIERNGK